MQPSTVPATAGRPPMLAERLAHEAPLAVGAILFRAHDRLRSVENLLELEAADPRVERMYRQVKALRKSVAAQLVELVATTVPTPEEA